MNDLNTAIRKKILGKFTYGVYVLTSVYDQDPHACTVTWVSQVSFDPLLVMVAIRRDSLMFTYVMTSQKFGLHVLREDQQELASRFFKKPELKDGTLGGVPFTLGELGVPIFTSMPAALECEVQAMTLLGDHATVVGEVKALHLHQDDEAWVPLRLHDTPWKYSG